MTKNDTIAVSIPETSVRKLREETNWPKDCPSGWSKIEATPPSRAGRGWTRRVTLSQAEAVDLADYLWDAAGASYAASRDEGGETGGWQRRLLARIEKPTTQEEVT